MQRRQEWAPPAIAHGRSLDFGRFTVTRHCNIAHGNSFQASEACLSFSFRNSHARRAAKITPREEKKSADVEKSGVANHELVWM